ncbi:hypothetical protein JOE58_001663 [Curtobacterium luteum]|uniref:Uncharacterized protein n=1 Tax=Curtobacterium luteum TaxID=33881 RepID=A0ABS2RTS7_9MICO|nr:hypothetical protein [Curtobacterium luteum]MBM7802412.1 hypothetical protein [Curtobacterium luteum]NUU50523.1 hypothetical protein [Curtobacterium luteum]
MPTVLDLPLLTDRFVLAPLGAAERTAFTAYRRDPAVARFQSWSPAWRHWVTSSTPCSVSRLRTGSPR